MVRIELGEGAGSREAKSYTNLLAVESLAQEEEQNSTGKCDILNVIAGSNRKVFNREVLEQ